MPIRLAPTVKLLVIINAIVFVVQQTVDQFLGGSLITVFGLVPNQFLGNFRLWQVVTYAFLHGDVFHLFLNMLMLVFIGSELELTWGRKRFLQYYFFCAVMAGFFYVFLQLVWKGGLYTPMVGASGSIYGLLVAYGIIFGERVLLFMLLFPMKAKHFIWILAALEFMTTVFSANGGLSGAAHLAGMVAGFGFLYTRARLQIARRNGSSLFSKGKSQKRQKKRKSSHLKLVKSEQVGHSEDPDDYEGGPKTWH